GRELWRLNLAGTPVRVADISPGPADAAPAYLTNVNGTLFFTANDGQRGNELWKTTPATNATTLVKDVTPGINGTTFSNLTAANGALYFVAADSATGSELWRSDGTAAG